jgi:hypothetical protein
LGIGRQFVECDAVFFDLFKVKLSFFLVLTQAAVLLVAIQHVVAVEKQHPDAKYHDGKEVFVFQQWRDSFEHTIEILSKNNKFIQAASL